MTKIDMTESTLQFIIKIFAVVLGLIILGVTAIFGFIVIRDGNSAEVTSAFDSLTTFAQWATGILGAIIVGKPIVSGLGNMMQANADQKSASAQTTLASIPPPSQAPSDASAI